MCRRASAAPTTQRIRDNTLPTSTVKAKRLKSAPIGAPNNRNRMYGKTGHHNHVYVEFPECAGHTCPFRVLCDHIPGHAGASTPDLGTTLGARAHTKTS